MVRKFFAQDKNYLLEESQLRLQAELLTHLVEKAKASYEFENNPLGLNDAFSERIRSSQPQNLSYLSTFYLNIAAIYRYKHGENQLGFLWDGMDHSEKYDQDWSSTFGTWTEKLCRHGRFVQAVLDLTVFLPPSGNAQMAENRMNAIMLERFELRIHKEKGIVEKKVA